jgi:GMP synthase (glutamine-hydrolysing)
MRLLIVEGNREETRIKRESFGIRPYHLIFKEMIHFLEPAAQVDIVFPAHIDKKLPTSLELKKFDGILWTGSSLSVLDDTPSVTSQLNFGEDIFNSGVPFYGSCWGLQIATVVAGGKVGKSKNGLELGVSKPIKLTNSGKKSSFFKKRRTREEAENFISVLSDKNKLPEEIVDFKLHSQEIGAWLKHIKK